MIKNINGPKWGILGTINAIGGGKGFYLRIIRFNLLRGGNSREKQKMTNELCSKRQPNYTCGQTPWTYHQKLEVLTFEIKFWSYIFQMCCHSSKCLQPSSSWRLSIIAKKKFVMKNRGISAQSLSFDSCVNNVWSLCSVYLSGEK